MTRVGALSWAGLLCDGFRYGAVARIAKKVIGAFNNLPALAADAFLTVHACFQSIFFANRFYGFPSAHDQFSFGCTFYPVRDLMKNPAESGWLPAGVNLF